MTALIARMRLSLKFYSLWDRVWLASLLLLLTIAIASPEQAADTLSFVTSAVVKVAPWLGLSVLLAAYAAATGADQLIAKAFTGRSSVMVVMGALVGALSPFCSCGVIPLIAALLAVGVPLPPVMAFWLASPVMDPAMFAVTAGTLGTEFAAAKTVAAIGLGLLGGFSALLLTRIGFLQDALRPAIGNGGCGGARIRQPKPVVWAFWHAAERRNKFIREAIKTSLFLAKWLIFAFILESLMLRFVPAEQVAGLVGGQGLGPILIGTAVGVPAYLNGYAALPLVSGLMAQGMSAGAAMAFLVAGGVSSIPAAIAVWAVVRPHVFFLYLGLALVGSTMAGLAYQMIQ